MGIRKSGPRMAVMNPAEERLKYALGRNFYTVRISRGYTRPEVCKAIGGISEQSLCAFELGESVPGLLTTLRLASFYGLDLPVWLKL